jgi:hypothetical protein
MNIPFLFCFEVILVLVNVLLWLGPFLKSVRKGILNTLHPQFITPLWIVYFILNTMIQNWYPWMGGTEHGILRTTSEAISTNPHYLIMPLIIVALCAPFYHFGVRLFCNSIIYSSSDRTQLITITQVVPKGQKIPFVALAFIVSGVVWLPNYFIPNADFGTFWTYPLAMTTAILPFMIFCVNKPVGLLSFGFALAGALVMRSKASLLYPLLPIAFYYFFFRFTFDRLKSWIILFVVMFLAVVVLHVGGFGTARKLLHRDYAFESFAALVDRAPNSYFGSAEYPLSGVSNGPYASWTLKEIEKGIPSMLYPNKRFILNPSKMVSRHFLPKDYKALPNAYFNRFLVFAGYYDLGIIGAFISALSFGALYGWFWRKTKRKIIKSGYLWPLFLYLPIPTIATYFVACGGLTYGFINALVPAGVVFVVVIISRWIMQMGINYRRFSLDIATKTY